MPEGDTIFRIAVTLRPVLEGRQIVDVYSRDRSDDVERLAGDQVRSVEARGKHLLIHFAGGKSLHSHLGMSGSWHVYNSGETWQKPRTRAAIALHLEDSTAVCFSPKTLELLSAAELRRHRYLNRLGPDLLASHFDHGEVVRRFRVHNSMPIGQAVMNQTIVCGIGNVYKSELLFLMRMNPESLVSQFSDQQLVALLGKARDLMTRNLTGYVRQTRFAVDGKKKWVYGRSGQPCLTCGATIELIRQGDLGRTTYFCPNCQPLGG